MYDKLNEAHTCICVVKTKYIDIDGLKGLLSALTSQSRNDQRTITGLNKLSIHFKMTNCVGE